MDVEHLGVREKLERSLGSRLPSAVWEELLDRGAVRDYLLGTLPGDGDWSYLRTEAAKLLRIVKRSFEELAGTPMNARTYMPSVDSGRLTSPRESDPNVWEPWETAKADADNICIADYVGKRPEVRSFRRELLGDYWPLTEEQAEQFMSSPALARLPRRWFKDNDISFVEHRSWLQEHEEPYPGYVDLFVQPEDSERIEQVTACSLLEDPVLRPDGLSPLVWSAGERWGAVRYCLGSALGELALLVKSIADAAMWWQAYDVVEFTLTGRVPDTFPLTAQLETNFGTKWRGNRRSGLPPTMETITFKGIESKEEVDELSEILEEARPSTAALVLRVAPWVSADSFRKAYRLLQKEITGNGKPSWEQNLRAYAFAKEKLSQGLGRSEITRMWNEEAPRADWRYARDGGFWQAYKNARRSVEEATFKDIHS